MYHMMGLLNVLTFMLTIVGLCLQLRMVLWRWRLFRTGALADSRPTSILSLNQMSSIYLACFAFFFYGLSLAPINHYLAWPRFIAVLLVIAILYQMVLDRRTVMVRIVFAATLLLLVALPLLFWIGPAGLPDPVGVGQWLIISATLVLGQGYWHQIHTIRTTGQTGAVSLRFHQCVLLTAVSTVLFGVSMGIERGWPLMLLATVSASLKLATMWHFRWVRISPLAHARRLAAANPAL